ncbi:MAG: fibronectin type III domain-containing protein [Verrucomicrobiota bacterium]|nr:fibronectin type III domain-containing protein [Verrucomicrobiota bacterium]
MQTNNEQLIARVSLRFMKLTVFVLITFLRNVIGAINKRPDLYKTPNPPISELAGAVDDLEVKAMAALDKSRNAILARDAQHKVTLALARQLASYVQNNCRNDVVCLTASGFGAVRRGSKTTEVIAPTNVRLRRNGNSGILDLQFAKVRNAVNYSVESSTKPEGPFTPEKLSTSTRVRLENREPGMLYYVRVRANGAPGSSEWTPVTSAMAV